MNVHIVILITFRLKINNTEMTSYHADKFAIREISHSGDFNFTSTIFVLLKEYSAFFFNSMVEQLGQYLSFEFT